MDEGSSLSAWRTRGFTCELEDSALGSSVWSQTVCRAPCAVHTLLPPFSPDLSL